MRKARDRQALCASPATENRFRIYNLGAWSSSLTNILTEGFWLTNTFLPENKNNSFLNCVPFSTHSVLACSSVLVLCGGTLTGL
jgi:hypothetical protein